MKNKIQNVLFYFIGNNKSEEKCNQNQNTRNHISFILYPDPNVKLNNSNTLTKHNFIHKQMVHIF